MRGAALLLVAAAVAAVEEPSRGLQALDGSEKTSDYGSRQERIRHTVDELTDLLDTPWTPISMVTEAFKTGLILDIENDVELASLLLFTVIRALLRAKAFDMIYVGTGSDGAFIGYYNEGAYAGSDGFVYTLLNGWDCPWNYTKACGAADEPCRAGYVGANPACRVFFDVDDANGAPTCTANSTGNWGRMSPPARRLQKGSGGNGTRSGNGTFDGPRRNGSFAASQPLAPSASAAREAELSDACDGKWLDLTVYDPRMRPWFNEMVSARRETMWSSFYPYASGDRVGISAMKKFEMGGQREREQAVVAIDFQLETLDAVLVGNYPNRQLGLAYLTDARGGSLVATSVGVPSAATGDEVLAVDSEHALIAKTAEHHQTHTGAETLVEWNLTVVSTVVCGSGEGFSRDAFECEACVAPTTSSPGSYICDECVEGYYLGGGACRHCPDGGACPGGRAQPHPKRGFWGDHDHPTEFWECEQGACEGGEDFSCNAGYHGRVCNRMDDDRYRVAEIQLACPDGAAARWALMGACCLVVFLLWYFINNFICEKYDAMDMLLLTLQQCAIIYEFDVPWAAQLSYLKVVLEIALFDVDLVQPNCVFRGWGFSYSFYLQCALPGVFAVVFFVPIGVRALRRVADGTVRTRRDFARLFDHYDGDLGAATSHAIKTFFITLDVCHTTITFKSLQVWRCDEYANGESFLRDSPDVRCHTRAHFAMRVLAAVCIAGVVVGWPLFSGFILRYYKRTYDGLHVPHVLERYGFLYDRYATHYLWDAWLCLRVVLLALVAVFVDSGPLQLAFAVLLLALCIGIQEYFRPFVYAFVNNMETGFLGLTLCFTVFGILFSTMGGSHRHTLAPFLVALFVVAFAVSIYCNYVEVRARLDGIEAAILIHRKLLAIEGGSESNFLLHALGDGVQVIKGAAGAVKGATGKGVSAFKTVGEATARARGPEPHGVHPGARGFRTQSPKAAPGSAPPPPPAEPLEPAAAPPPDAPTHDAATERTSIVVADLSDDDAPPGAVVTKRTSIVVADLSDDDAPPGAVVTKRTSVVITDLDDDDASDDGGVVTKRLSIVVDDGGPGVTRRTSIVVDDGGDDAVVPACLDLGCPGADPPAPSPTTKATRETYAAASRLDTHDTPTTMEPERREAAPPPPPPPPPAVPDTPSERHRRHLQRQRASLDAHSAVQSSVPIPAHDRKAALQEASRTFEGTLWLEWARHASDDDLVRCGRLVTKLDPYVCDAAPTSVFAGDDRSNFWRDMVEHYPPIIDFSRHLDHAARLEFFSHLVTFQRFMSNSTSKRYASIVDQDRSSILYFILTESEANVDSLVALLDGLEHHRSRLARGAQPPDEPANLRAARSIKRLAQDKSARRLADSKHDPRVALTGRFNDLEDAVLRVEKVRRESFAFDAGTFLAAPDDDPH
ncbi:hypothetical protein JL722_3555 [Aureococcus anophagefferens]|nr:hypothetical protein JL722_3555 [Aureococcus anophagefferens]